MSSLTHFSGSPAKRQRRDSGGLFVTPGPTSTIASLRSGSLSSELPDPDVEDADSLPDEAFDAEEPSYDQLQELYPSRPAFDERIAHAVETSSRLSSGLLNIFEQHRASSKAVENMADKAADSQQCPQARKPKIMFLGDTGTGKSSTVNSVVDDMHATKKGATGLSCTCVPTLITSDLPGQLEKYAAEIRFFDIDTRRDFLNEQIKNFNLFVFEADSDWTPEEKKEHQAKADDALKIMRALFCDTEHFSSPGAARSFLAFEHERGVQPVLDMFMSRCETLFDVYSQIEGHPYLRLSAETGIELEEQVRPHIFESPCDDKPTLWPLVEHVRKGIRGSRILEHVELLDLPGTADTNRVRASIAHKFIQESDGLWIAATASRAAANASLDRAVATYGERFGDNVAIIVTNSDLGINAALAREMVQQNKSIGDHAVRTQEINDLTDQIATMNARLRKGSGNKRSRTLSERDQLRLHDQLQELQKRVQSAKNAQFEGLVEVRNSSIRQRLQEEKQTHLAPGAKLSVFCVSNTHYAALKGEPAEDACQMSAECTEIPALRRHALELAAPAEFREAEAYINRNITLFRGAEMWVDFQAGTGRHKELMDVFNQPSELFKACIGRYQESAMKAFRQLLYQPLEDNRHRFIISAIKFQDKISQWHASTIRAFIRNNGRHQTPCQAFEVWNERFTDDQTTSVIDRGWISLVEKQKADLKSVSDELMESLAKVPKELNKLPCAVPLRTARFMTIVEGFMARVRVVLEHYEAAVDKKLSNLKLDASRDVPTAYFTRAMGPVYDDCKDFSGAGCTSRMQDRLQTFLRNPGHDSPFAAVQRGLDTDISALFNTSSRTFQTQANKILNEMTGQFDVILRSEAQTPGERQTRNKLRPWLELNKAAVEEMARDLAAIKMQYGS